MERLPEVLGFAYSEARGLLEPLRRIRVVTTGTRQPAPDIDDRRVVRQRELSDAVELTLGSSASYAGGQSG